MNPRHSQLSFFRKARLLFVLVAGFLSSAVSASESYIAVEAHSGKILLELNASQKRPVASLAKIATAMVVLDWANLSKTSMSQMMVVPNEVLGLGGSNPMALQPGDRISIREAMYSMLLGSDNIAAHTLADHAGRSIQSRSGGSSPVGAFVKEMNNLARGLGMSKTRFANPTGLDGSSRSSSTARDMARLSIYAMRNTGFQFYVKQKSRTISSIRAGQKRAFKVGNTHQLIGKNGVSGIRTGLSNLAGQCAATSVEKKPIVQKQTDGRSLLTSRRLIIITLGSADRWAITRTLISQGWAAYDGWRAQGATVGQARELLTVPNPQ